MIRSLIRETFPFKVVTRTTEHTVVLRNMVPVGVSGVAAVAGADGAVAAHRALRVRAARVRRAGVKPVRSNE